MFERTVLLSPKHLEDTASMIKIAGGLFLALILSAPGFA
jgi:hypothetical protein